MIGERENFDSQARYGALIMRPYNIDGNEFNAFYDLSDRLIFVLDNTINNQKPNVLLVINPSADKKWDEILSGEYGVDLETIRPKVDNKYQKLDIEYSGLAVYDGLIKAYNAGDALEEPLNQLTILRASAARHSAMMRLNVANENITKINATIVKTKESIVRLQARLKTLRAKLSEAKKGIGREPTKQSAAKVLKLEAQIDATNEKLKRAQERLKSAQRRLEIATVDAELASELLNQPSEQLKQSSRKVTPIIVETKAETPVVKTKKVKEEPVVVETEETEETTTVEEDDEEDVKKEKSKTKVVKKEYDDDEEDESFDDDDDFEEDDEFLDEDSFEDDDFEDEDEDSDEEKEDGEDTEKVKPLFNKDPQILNEDLAFKPITFEAPAVPSLEESEQVPEETVETEETTEIEEETEKEEPQVEEKVDDKKPVLESMMPIATERLSEVKEEEPVEDLPVIKEQETVVEEPLKIEKDRDYMWQSEPVSNQELKDTKENNNDNYMPPRPPVMPAAPVMPSLPYTTSGTEVVHEIEVKRSKPTLFYYLLLILLIILSVFTLWLYQKNIRKTSPVFATTVERTETDNSKSFFKKTGNKTYKPVVIKEREVEDVAPFFDEKPAVNQKETVTVEDTEPEEEPKPVFVLQEETKGAPQVIDDVPGRVGTSTQPVEEKKVVMSEEDVLAKKPIYEPGSKHDEMFVAADEYVGDGLPADDEESVEYVEEDIMYAPETEEVIEHVEYEEPSFDDETMEYYEE